MRPSALLVVACSSVLSCGRPGVVREDGQGGSIDTGGPPEAVNPREGSDAPVSPDSPSAEDGPLAACQDLQARWRAAVRGVERECRTASDCTVAGGNVERCGCSVSIGSCDGMPVNVAAYGASGLIELERRFARECLDARLPKTCDCGPGPAGCVGGQCARGIFDCFAEPRGEPIAERPPDAPRPEPTGERPPEAPRPESADGGGTESTDRMAPDAAG